MHTSNTTRTERALIRNQFRRHRETPVTAFQEVVEFFGRPSGSVWSAIRNRERDDVENDGAYLDGIVGELINIDLLADEDIPVLETSFEEKLDDTETPDDEGMLMDDEMDVDGGIDRTDNTDELYGTC